MPVVLLLLLLSTTHNYLCGSRILYQCCCCFLLRVSATWSHGEVIDSNSLPKRKGRREKVNVKKKKTKKNVEKDSCTYIYSLMELICVTARKDNITTSSPLSLLTFRAVSPMSFKPAKKDREQGHFFLGQEKS